MPLYPITKTYIYPASRYFTVGLGDNTGTATAVGTLDTVIYLQPTRLRAEVTITSLSIRVVTGGTAGSACKFGVWGNNDATMKPTSTAITGLVSNTEQVCTGTGSNPALTGLSKSLSPGLYWFGVAFTTAAPTCIGWVNNAHGYDGWYGRSAISNNNSTNGYTAPYTYATDITALDLTAAALTDVTGNGGVPVMWFGT